jgi:hypothetical protein
MFSLEEAKGLVICGDYDDEQYTLVQSNDDWSGDKYEWKSTVVQSIDSGKYYEVVVTRTGSYYTDYEYIGHDVFEVEPETVTIVKYVPVGE